MKTANTGSWTIQKETILLKTPIFSVNEVLCRSDDSKEFKYSRIKSDSWCNLIPVTEDGKVVFVRQWRVGIDEYTLEVPGGVIDPGDSNGKEAALREMEEETGYSLLPQAKVQELGWNYPNPAILNNRCFSFVVGPVKKTSKQNLDPGERIEVVEVPIEEIPSLIVEGKITHALILVTFFMLHLQSESGKESLRKNLEAFTKI